MVSGPGLSRECGREEALELLGYPENSWISPALQVSEARLG